ncbi:MAG: acetylxylan esterase [Petrimonas sp.]|nr:acetylxylan esterase [Petrimonas sp.]
MTSKKILLSLLLLVFAIALKSQNYEESNVQPYTLPELLKTESGQVIATADEWMQIRRPEVLRLFEDNVYGQVPKSFDAIYFKKTREEKNVLNGKATVKEVNIIVTRNIKQVTIHLLLFVPNKVKKPVPAFLVINHRGMETMDVTRGNKDDFWPVEQVIDAGYALAGFDVKDVAPDDKERFADELLQKLYPDQLAMNNGMRALGAWGWGASRIIDYFETDPAVDAGKVVVVGHSRGGKAALWCGAQDQRVAVAISNESGNSGAKISRRNFGESVEAITKNFPYWFCKNYQQYANNEDKLPVDQHMLIALQAPRGVYVSAAEEDRWADNKGQYLSLIEAQPVFNLYGFNLNLPLQMPSVGNQLFEIPMGCHIREGKHDMTLYDWQQFIRFANTFFQKK